MHTCKRNKSCTCEMWMYEPSDDCPIHMGGEWPPRCVICGRFMKWDNDPN
jgi:hypothetical protein